MPRFIYTAKTQDHQTIQADIYAESEQDAINKLTKIGYFPISIKVEDLTLEKEGIRRFWKIPRKDIVQFSRQLSSLIESGVNVLNSLNIISEQIPNKYLKAIIRDVANKIKDGQSLSESLATYPHLFSNLYTSLVRSGEVGGNLEIALKRVADFLEKEEEFRDSVRQALAYPVFVFIVSVLTVIILLGFVIPRLVSMFEDMGQILPLSTQLLISISAILRAYWWLILALIFISVFLLRRFYQRPKGKLFLDRLKLKLPILGDIILKTQESRLMRTLSLLLSGATPVVYALEVSISTVENQILRQELQAFKEEIANGLSFSKCLSNSKLFSPFITNMVTVGEESGTLEKSLMRIADDYEREVDRKLKTFTRLLEPTIILVMGLIVGFIVLSMLLPIFQINLIVQ